MREIDKIFLRIFKDLKLAVDKNSPDDNPRYVCYIGKQAVSRDVVVSMVKEYQDEIVKLLLESNEEV